MDFSQNTHIHTKPTLHSIWCKQTDNKNLLNDTIQLLTNIINVKHLLYSYANVMQQPDSSSYGLFTIAYATDITFELTQKNLFTMCHKCDRICLTT